MRSMMLETVSPSVQVETLARHDPAHRLVERGGAALGERAHDVAFGEDADDAAVHAEDERRADTLSASSATAEESVALGSTLTTSRPLAARMMLTVIVASLIFTAWAPPSGGAATVKAIV